MDESSADASRGTDNVARIDDKSEESGAEEGRADVKSTVGGTADDENDQFEDKKRAAIEPQNAEQEVATGSYLSEIEKQLSEEVQSRSEAILRVVGGESADRSSLTDGKAAAVQSRQMAASRTVAKHSTKNAASCTATTPSADIICSTRTPRDISLEDLELIEAAKEASQQMSTSNEVSRELGDTNPPGLSRGRYSPKPGAVHVAGLGDVSSDDDDSIENNDEASIGSVRSTASLAFDSPIHAVLVEDIPGSEVAREIELEEREAELKRREAELERRMQRMRASSIVVEAHTVTTDANGNQNGQKRKTPLQKFAKSLGLRGKTTREPEIPSTTHSRSTKSSPKASASTSKISESSKALATEALLNENTPVTAVINTLLKGHAGGSSRNQLVEGSGHLSQQEFIRMLGKESDCLTPLLGRSEIHLGKKVGAGQSNCLFLVKSLEISDSCEDSEIRAFCGDGALEQQKKLRRDLMETTKGKDKYVMKCLRSDLDGSKKLAAATELMSEANLLSNLNHPNIISVQGMAPGSTSTTPDIDFFYVVHQLDKTLYECLTKSWRRRIKGPQFFADRIKVATDVASAVDFLHSLNIMYSDLKPENIGFDFTGNLKLFNFGGAKPLTESANPYDSSAVTTNLYIGTHPYVAPEVALRRPSGINADTYVFGVLLWEISTMKEPFSDLMIHEYTEKVIQGNRRPKLERKVPSEINDLMTDCWAVNPSARPSMQKVHLRLLEFQEKVTVGTTKKGFSLF